MKELSDWALMRVRETLRAYHRYYRDSEGQYATWAFVWEEITDAAEENGIMLDMTPKNGTERVRQFVEGVKDPDNPDHRRYPVPKPKVLEAIVAFLTHEDAPLLSGSELEEHIPSVHAALRLSEYFRQPFDPRPLYLPPEFLEGHYRTSRVDGDEMLVRDLYIERALESGMLQVFQFEDVYNLERLSVGLNTLPPAKLAARRTSQLRHSGWVILTPEDNLLFFLKEERTGLNRYYLSLASDMNTRRSTQVTRLILLHFDYPWVDADAETEPTGGIVSKLMSEMQDCVICFKRYEPAPTGTW